MTPSQIRVHIDQLEPLTQAQSPDLCRSTPGRAAGFPTPRHLPTNTDL